MKAVLKTQNLICVQQAATRTASCSTAVSIPTVMTDTHRKQLIFQAGFLSSRKSFQKLTLVKRYEWSNVEEIIFKNNRIQDGVQFTPELAPEVTRLVVESCDTLNV